MNKNSSIDNSQNKASQDYVSKCYSIWENAWASYRAAELLQGEFTTKVYILNPHLERAWLEIEAILANLPLPQTDPSIAEKNLRTLIANQQAIFRSFQQNCNQENFYQKYELTTVEQAAVLKQVFLLGNILREIEVYLLKLQGWCPWYQRRLVHVILLAIFLWWLVGVIKVQIMRSERGYTIESASQAWGNLQLDKSVAQTSLRVSGSSCATGIGTHAKSEISIRTVLSWLVQSLLCFLCTCQCIS